MSQPGDEVIFAITVVNAGSEAVVESRIVDRLPDYLEILEVRVMPEEQGPDLGRRTARWSS